MSDYKCEQHKIDLICAGCVRAWIARHDRMLEFIKNIGWCHRYTDEEIKDFNDVGHYLEAKEARDLLKEIGR